MATARERLRQLTIGQEAATELASFAQEAAELEAEPIIGGDILDRPVRPSEAAGLTAEPGSPFEDFGEFFLNQIGITSERQRRAALERLMAEDEANKALIHAAQEHLAAAAKGGTNSPDETERFKQSQLFLENGTKLIDNPNRNIRAIGRKQIQSAIKEIDFIIREREDARDIQRNRIQSRVDNITNALLAERQNNDDVIALVNRYASSNGASAQLPITIKQKFGEYLGAVSFGQPGQQTIFGVPIAFDPSDTITAGNALAMVADVTRKRQATLVNQLSQEVQAGTDNGFTFNEKDGRLAVNEILIPALSPESEKLIMQTPQGEPMTIQPGLPTREQSVQAGKSFAAALAGLIRGGGTETLEIAEDLPIVGGAIESINNSLTDDKGFLEELFSPEATERRRQRREQRMRESPGLFQPGGLFGGPPPERETN